MSLFVPLFEFSPCGQERQNACLEPRRRQNIVGFNTKGFGVWITASDAHCDKGRDYRERGGSNPAVTFDPKLCYPTPQREAQLGVIFFRR
jgi:hypothetical protein